MNRALDFIRRHPRLLAGVAAIFLAALVTFAVRANGPAHAAVGAAAHAQVSGPAGASASRPARAHPARFVFASATVASTPARRHVNRGGATGRSGVPTAAPNPTELAKALRQATGLSPAQVTTQRACPPAAKGQATCAAEVLVLRSDHARVRPLAAALRAVRAPKPALNASPNEPAAFTPEYLQQAYDLTGLSSTGGHGDTVAIVDVGDDPTAASDLAAYRNAYNLGACAGCLQKVNETGGTSSFPSTDSGWLTEESLDLDAVTAICPNCHILLVEANSSSLSDLDTAMATAHSLGANQISDSWSAVLESPPSGTYAWSGTATVAATGDNGYVGLDQSGKPAAAYPAALPSVTAAGGTTLSPAGAARGFGEGAWSGGGSGCNNEAGIHKPAYQTDTGCNGRSYADVSADADPNTGLTVDQGGSWGVVGGTSLATPLIAAYYAITGVNDASPQWAYGDSGLLNDITSGSNGSCPAKISYICNAQPGYDGPTGVGSISGDVVAGAPGIGGPSITSGTTNTYTEATRSDGATITAGIYPNGLDTTWWIQYWPASGGTAQSTPAADIGSGTAPVTVTGYPSHLAANTTYDYELIAENSDGTTAGYTSSFTTSAASSTAPAAAFSYSPTASQPGSGVTFNASGSTDSGATIKDYSWDFGDGTGVDAAGGPTTSHTYVSAGSYNVTLIVTNTRGQSETTTQTVTVDAPPTASFTVSPAQPTPGSPVSFDPSSSTDSFGKIAGYSWNFGDTGANGPGTSTARNPAYTYAARGTYTVKLTVTNDAGQRSTTTQQVTVDAPPTGTISPSPTATTPGSAVSFTTTAAAAAGGSIAGYSWNFGDPGSTANTSTAQNPSHTYASPGVYPVTLTVTDDLGVSATETGQVTVDTPPTASFTAPPSPATPGSLSFDGGGSTDRFGTITGYSWSFVNQSGSQQTATGQKPTVTLARGIYTVGLTVTNDAGQTSPITTQQVAVDDPPNATTTSFTPSATVIQPGSSVSFTSTASSPDATGGGSISSYSWNFADGNPSTDPHPAHSYGNPGVYPVSLTVTDDLGETYTTPAQNITVDATPTAAFTTSPSQPNPQQTVTFDASGSSDSYGTIQAYSWNFGDTGANGPGTSSLEHPTYTYANPGTYTVTLTVTNDAGQTGTTTQQVTVDTPPTATITATPALTTPGSPVSFTTTAASPATGGSITNYTWNFGDGTPVTGTDANPTHTYTSPGIYTVTLIVTDNLGVTATASTQVTVDAAPTAAFTVSSNPVAGAAAAFNAAGSSDSVGTITGYSWNFGDNTTATGKAPSHVYASPGTYTVSLTVTNNAGQSATRTATITVNSAASPTPPATSPPPTPAPTAPAPTAPAPTTPAPTTPAPQPFSASLTAARKQRLAPALAHGVRVSLSVSQAAGASFQITLPVTESRLAHAGGNPKGRSIVVLRARAQSLGAGAHTIMLRLSRASARELAAAGPLVVTVKVTLTEPSGATISRTIKVTLTR